MTDNREDMLEFDDMEDSGIVTLTDENGEEVDFEFLDLVEYEGGEYVVLLPLEDEGENLEVLILQIIAESEDEETYAGVESEEILAAVFAIFKERNKDLLNFAE